MQLYDAMFVRRSVRAYDMTPLTDETLEQLVAAIAAFPRLYDGVEPQYRFATEAKNMNRFTAPHYLCISGDGTAGELEAAGFLYQLASLWLTTNGIGSIWLAGARDAAVDNPADFVTIAFGTPTESLTRTAEEFQRKPIEEITNAVNDDLIEALRIAPTGMNSQPWYFEKTEDKVLVYRRPLDGPAADRYRLSDLDIGIGLSHYYLAAEHAGKAFNFVRADDLPAKEGLISFGVIS